MAMKANSLIIGSFFIAMCLSVIALPAWMLWLRPEFTLIVLIYWTLTIPDRCGLVAAMVVGLCQDTLTASLLGKHMLSYIVITALILFTYQRLRMFGVWQQALFIFLLLAIAQMVEFSIAMAIGNPPVHFWILLPALVGALLWPWIMIFLREMSRKMGVLNNV
jgi:rod shape-determining protein MreD